MSQRLRAETMAQEFRTLSRLSMEGAGDSGQRQTTQRLPTAANDPRLTQRNGEASDGDERPPRQRTTGKHAAEVAVVEQDVLAAYDVGRRRYGVARREKAPYSHSAGHMAGAEGSASFPAPHRRISGTRHRPHSQTSAADSYGGGCRAVAKRSTPLARQRVIYRDGQRKQR